jgi:hypothetical protein
MPAFKDWLDKALDLAAARATRRRQVGADAVGDTGEPCGTYFKPMVKWAARRSLMIGAFSELEQPAQAEKVAGFVPTPTSASFCAPGGSPRDIAIRVMLLTGARCLEACKAVWSAFDLDRRMGTLPGHDARTQSPVGSFPTTLCLARETGCALRTIGFGEPDKLAFPGARGAALRSWPMA